MDGTFNPLGGGGGGGWVISLMLHFYPKMLLISGHKNLVVNSQVIYINIFKTSVPSKWFLGLEYFQT